MVPAVGKVLSAVLKFQNFRTEIFETAYKTLKNDKSFGNHKLYEITETYLNFIGEELEMTIHEQGQIIGKPIGYFAYQIGNSGKDLLFNLRNLKKHSQFVEYIRDLHFRILFSFLISSKVQTYSGVANGGLICSLAIRNSISRFATKKVKLRFAKPGNPIW